MEENGDIYARGAQDRKSNGMQHLAAIRALRRNGVKQLKRTIHVVFVPNEEVGGLLGMHGFVKSKEFKQMNVGFVLDEGMSRDKPDEIGAYYAERTIWKIELTFHGNSGHGSLLLNDTAAQKLNYVVNKFTEMRATEARKLNVLGYLYGKVTSINLTILRGGVANNVIPPEIKAIFDIRLSIDADFSAFETQVRSRKLSCKSHFKSSIQFRRLKIGVAKLEGTSRLSTHKKSQKRMQLALLIRIHIG